MLKKNSKSKLLLLQTAIYCVRSFGYKTMLLMCIDDKSSVNTFTLLHHQLRALNTKPSHAIKNEILNNSVFISEPHLHPFALQNQKGHLS